MKCKCGSRYFTAHQVCHHDIIVDDDGKYKEDLLIYYHEKSFGPFTCIKCGSIYEELEEEKSQENDTYPLNER